MANEQYFNSNFYGNQIERMLEGLYNSSGILKSNGNGTISQALEADFLNGSSFVLVTRTSTDFYGDIKRAVDAGKIPIIWWATLDRLFLYSHQENRTDAIGTGAHYYFTGTTHVFKTTPTTSPSVENVIIGNISEEFESTTLEPLIKTGVEAPTETLSGRYRQEYINLNTNDRYICLGPGSTSGTYVWQKIQNGVLDIATDTEVQAIINEYVS